MPSTLPSTFASAAAGNNDSSNRASSRPDGPGEPWGRRTNGATQTFRRPSTATTQSHVRESSQTAPNMANTSQPPTPSIGAYVPPHISRQNTTLETRYSRNQLLDLFKEQRDAGDLETDLSELYVGEDAGLNGSDAGGGPKWGRHEPKENGVGPDICWDRGGGIEPLGIMDMSEAEKELFTTSVNSPIKAVTTQGNRDNGQRDTLNRKASGLGGNSTATFASPGLTRTARRRAPSESYPFPSSDATAGDDNIEGISAATGAGLGLSRRKTERQEDIAEQTDEVATPGTAVNNSNAGFGSMKRNPFGPISAGLNGPASPWGASAQPASSPMGAFRGIGFGSTPAASSSNRPGFGSTRGGSRFADLMKSSIEDEPSSLHSKPSMGSFGLSEDPSSRRHTPALGDDGSERAISRAVSRAGTFGSAALGGLHDVADSRSESTNPVKGRGGHYGQGQGHGNGLEDFNPGEANSPTYTNPYQSPPHQANSIQDLADDMDMNVLPGLGGFQRAPGQDPAAGAFGESNDNRQGQFPYDSRHFDRPEATNRGFPGLGGLGGLGGLPGLGNPGPWSSGLATTTPGRERAQGDGFGDHAMRTPGAFSSPTVGVGGVFGGSDRFGYGGTGTIGRGSKLSSLYSGSTQDQLQGSRDDGTYDQEGDILNGLGGSRRETESPFRAGRGKFDDFFHSGEKTGEQNQTYSPASALQTPLHQPALREPSVGSSASREIPASQQKTMVMPDRIRWVYKDPQGNQQGPWTGLEMHDWYRAGFFSPELLVKKVEDADYEPLAQLIRRIGNSREPFLVPQIGIPGPVAAQAAPPASWTTQNVPQAPAAQPPFASNFPSFGTTLTADQQNALERRKQEEQYLMHQQKEHLAWQQNVAKQMQMQGQPGFGRQGLSHQQSMQSLNSQPSYGSMNSPSAYQAHPVAGNGAAFEAFNRGTGVGPIGAGHDHLGNIREEHMPGSFDHAHEQDSYDAQAPIGQQRGHNDIGNEQRVVAMLADRARLAQEQAEQDAHHDNVPATNERLNEFLELRRQEEEQEAPSQAVKTRQVSGQKTKQTTKNITGEVPIEKLSLTEQVQKAASAKASPAVAPKSAWAHSDLETLPPPQSISPLPAPAARRNRANMADTLAAESISVSQSPAPETPTSIALAPWANAVDQQKQPSLREIQEAEARRAAKQEEILQGLRRAQLEKEMAELARQPQSPAPGLPTSSTWATSEAAATPASTASPWAKATASKAAASSGSSTKKTLQQIQAEEEAIARKKKAALVAAAASAASLTGGVPAPSGGKRYADLASKAASTTAPFPGAAAWTTVGASGKVKTPAPAPAPAPARTVSTSTTAATPAVSAKTKASTAAAASAKTTLVAAQKQAQDEFRKWAVAELRPDLDKSIQVDDFVLNLLSLPSDVELVTEAVHMSSRTMDSRHFAEEFVRRRALAEKGKMEAGAMGSTNSEAKNGSGWSEVARRAGTGSAGAAGVAVKEEPSAFKVVAKKGKGKK